MVVLVAKIKLKHFISFLENKSDFVSGSLIKLPTVLWKKEASISRLARLLALAELVQNYTYGMASCRLCLLGSLLGVILQKENDPAGCNRTFGTFGRGF